jgi:cytochrome b
MTINSLSDSERESARTLPSSTASSTASSTGRDIPVWDPLIRLIHWCLVLAILLNGAILKEGSLPHRWVGYSAVGLVALRLVWGLLGPQHARLSAFPPNPLAALRHIKELLEGDTTVHLSHNPLGGLMVYNLWLTILALGVTGYMMGTVRFFGMEWVEDIHETLFGWLIASILLHIVGVVFETWRSGVPLVRAMVDGRKRIPENKRIKA